MTKLVPDASIALEWYIPDLWKDEAALILDRYDRGEVSLIVPDLLFPEMVNVLATKPFVTEEDGIKAIEHLINLNLEVVPTIDIIERTFTLAREYKLAGYDAVYLAASEKAGAIFVTADEKLYQAVGTTLSWVCWAGEYV